MMYKTSNISNQYPSAPYLGNLGIIARAVAAGVAIASTVHLLDFFLNDDVYTQTVKLITAEINYAHCVAESKKRTVSLSCDVYVPTVYPKERVQTILNTYIRLVLDSPNLPEFDAATPHAAKASEQIINAVRQKTGEPNDTTVRLVLNQLYWSTVQNRVRDTAFLNPRTARNNAQYRQTPEQYKEKGFWDNVKDTVGKVETILIGGAVVVAGVMLYNTFKDERPQKSRAV